MNVHALLIFVIIILVIKNKWLKYSKVFYLNKKKIVLISAKDHQNAYVNLRKDLERALHMRASFKSPRDLSLSDPELEM